MAGPAAPHAPRRGPLVCGGGGCRGYDYGGYGGYGGVLPDSAALLQAYVEHWYGRTDDG